MSFTLFETVLSEEIFDHWFCPYYVSQEETLEKKTTHQ